MSLNLHWYKPPTERKALGEASLPLKGILARRYGEHDGSLGENFILDERDIPFLEGLVAAHMVDADKLLNDLKKYGSLECDIS